VKPRSERFTEQSISARLGKHLEQRIDARLDRAFAQQVCAKTVNGADVRLFEALNGIGQVCQHRRFDRTLAQVFQFLADPELQFAGSFLSERHRHELFDLRAAARQDAEDAPHQLGCLACTSRRFDDDRVVETVPDQIAIDLVAKGPLDAHGFLRRAVKSAVCSVAFR